MESPYITPRTEKIIKRCLAEFESKVQEDDKAAGTHATIREFGLSPDEVMFITAAISQFYIDNHIDMVTGVGLALTVGMMMGRELDSELRAELEEELGGIGS